jgi:hypothetical protein
MILRANTSFFALPLKPNGQRKNIDTHDQIPSDPTISRHESSNGINGVDEQLLFNLTWFEKIRTSGESVIGPNSKGLYESASNLELFLSS